MDRLTIEYLGGYAPKGLCSIDRLGSAYDCELCYENCKTMEERTVDCSGCAINQCFNRLGEYENTGLTPEQIIEMDKLYAEKCKELAEFKRSDEQGLLLRLPCRVGDTVYLLRIDNTKYLMSNKKEWEIVETSFEIRHFESIGKTVFLTRTEAEEALERMEGRDAGSI